MRGMVVPSSPCCPSTSAAAFKSLRVDSLLRACCGSSVLFAIGLLLELSKILLDINVNVNYIYILEIPSDLECLRLPAFPAGTSFKEISLWLLTRFRQTLFPVHLWCIRCAMRGIAFG